MYTKKNVFFATTNLNTIYNFLGNFMYYKLILNLRVDNICNTEVAYNLPVSLHPW